MRLRPPLASLSFPLGLCVGSTLLAVSLSACGAPDSEPADVSAAPADMVISGRYDVKGLTLSPGTPDRRKIQGSVIIVRQGDRYTATYELGTTWPAEGIDTDADVVGVGEGRIEGGTLTGEARTQLVISSVPGVDPGFAFVPRTVTKRIVSTSVAKIAPDGSIEIEINNRGAEGEQYDPTRTRLLGRRVEARIVPKDPTDAPS